MIGIIDFQVNNVGSVVNAVDSLDVQYKIVSEPRELEYCDLVILPGVGSFDSGMNALHSLGFSEALRSLNLDETKILGICLGMQLLFSASDEGELEGLGFFSHRVRSLRSLGCDELIPHVGFNDVFASGDDEFFSKHCDNKDYYFVH